MNGCFRTLNTNIAAFVRQQLATKLGIAIVASLLAPTAVLLLHAVAAPMHRGSSGTAVAQEATCGNGILDPGEQCDDGNTQDGDCCSATCQFEAAGDPCADSNQCTGPDTCDGNGFCVSGPQIVCPPPDPCYNDGVCDPSYGCGYSPKPNGTPCDDGIACSFDDQCVGGDCMGTVPTCGDGVVESQGGCEQCDDGNTQSGDGCNASCRLEWSARMCQESINRGSFQLLRGLRAVQRCRYMLNRGIALSHCDGQPLTDPTECPNECRTLRAIQMANRMARRMTARGCTDTTAHGLGACAGTVDGLIGPDLSTGCLIDAFATATNALVAQEYGQLTTGDSALTTCQQAIGAAASGYAMAVTMSLSKCRNSLNRNMRLFFDQAKTQPLTDPADCPNEFKTYSQIVSLGHTAYVSIAGDVHHPQNCTDAQVSSLGLCASTVDGLVSSDGSGGCLVTGHLTQVNALIDAEY